MELKEIYQNVIDGDAEQVQAGVKELLDQGMPAEQIYTRR